jgi:Coenzyme PQQ synthesis protein D (PqqD)
MPNREPRYLYRTRRFAALGHDFECCLMDAELGQRVERILDPFASPGRGATVYRLFDGGTDGVTRFSLFYQDELVADCGTDSQLVETLLWHVNRRIVSSSPDYLMFHAAAVAKDGRAVIMPAPTGSGKTTLAAELVRAGMDYLSDEVVAVDPESGLVHPVPKSLALKAGSWPLFPAPSIPPDGMWSLDPTAPRHIDPRRLRADSISGLAVPSFVVFPRYVPGGPTGLRGLAQDEGLVLLAENAFNLAVHGRRGLRALCAMVETAPCLELVVGDLHVAGRLVAGLFEGAPPVPCDLPPADLLGGRSQATPVDGRVMFRAKGSVDRAAASGRAVLLDRATESVHVLNQSATAVWAKFDTELSFDDLVRRLSTEFNVEPAEICANVQAVIGDLLDLGLIEAVGVQSAA